MDTRDRELSALRGQIEELQAHLQRLAGTEGDVVQDNIKNYLDKASESMKGYVDQTAAQLKEKMATAGDVTKRAGERVGNYASENPWHVAAFTLLTGIVVASLIHRDKQ